MKRAPWCLLVLGACGGEVGADATTPKVRVDATTEVTPTKSGIAAFLRLTGYKMWKAEAAVHPSKWVWSLGGRMRTQR